MKTRFATIAIIPVVALALAAFAPACRRGAAPEAAEHHAEDPAGPAGTVQLSEEALKTGGVVLEPVRSAPMARRVSAPGEIELNARRLARISARSAGRLERLAAFRGERVAPDQVLAEIYSRDFLALQAEVIQASARAARLAGGPDREASEEILAAAKAKLIPLGLTAAEVDELVRSKEIKPLLPVRAPFAGRLIGQTAVAGDSVEAGALLYELADLQTVWACLHIQEKDLAAVAPGAEAVLKAQAFPGREFRGRLVLLEALMDEKTRTIEGRVEVANPGESLRPGMYIEAAVAAGEPRVVLSVPESALQESAQGPVVFVRTGPGRFTLRLVETGQREAGRVEIRGGLADADEVVTAGSFLLKSELLKKTLGD